MKDVSGVVVLYEPTQSVVDNIASYRGQVDRLFVVDNSIQPDPSVVDRINGLSDTSYVWNGQNLGIAHALNVGAKQALDSRCQFLLTMDQDSVASIGMVESLVSCAEREPSLGMVSPFHMDKNSPDPVPTIEREDIVATMTSGSIVRLAAYQHVGGFLEDLFIDYVDDEYCLRLKAHGWKIVRLNRAIVYHSLGHMTTQSFFGRTVRPTHHSPERYFYQTRNRIYLRRMYGKRFPAYFRSERKRQMGRLVKMVLYERNRLRKTWMVIRGLIAGWQGHVGRLSGS